MTEEGGVRRRSILKTGAGLLTAGTAALAGCSTGGGDGGSFPESEIRWIVPYGAGGGYDAYSRALSEFMPEYLPNENNIVVENVPGAGARTGTAEVWRADPDGTTTGMLDTFGVGAFQSAINPDFDDFDIAEFEYYGTVAWEPYTLWVAGDSDLETTDDLQSADTVSFAESGVGSAATNSAIIASEVMDINADFVMGYDGTAESMTAVARGDAQVTTVNPSSARPQYEDGNIRPITVFADEPIEWAPESEAAGELGFDEMVKVGRFERAIGLPPDTDQEIVDAYAQAWLDVVEDDGFQNWSEENNRPIIPKNAEETQQTVEDAIETFSEFQDVFADFDS